MMEGESNKRKFGNAGIMDRDIIVGVCAMSKKVQGKEMREILARLRSFPDFQLVIFSDDVILNSPIEEWPLCDTLICFFSTGFPLDKAEAYATLRKPFMVNDVSMQRVLMDRRKTYALLKKINIPVPRHACMSRDAELAPTFVVEEDCIYVRILWWFFSVFWGGFGGFWVFSVLFRAFSCTFPFKVLIFFLFPGQWRSL